MQVDILQKCSTAERFQENLKECTRDLGKTNKFVINAMCAIRRKKGGIAAPSGRYKGKELVQLMVGAVLCGAIPAFEDALKQLWAEEGALKEFREKLEAVGKMPAEICSPILTNHSEDVQYNRIMTWIESCQQLERTSFATSVMLKARSLFDPTMLCPKAKLYHELEQKAEKLVTEAIMQAREQKADEDRERVLGEACESIAKILTEEFKKECLKKMNEKVSINLLTRTHCCQSFPASTDSCTPQQALLTLTHQLVHLCNLDYCAGHGARGGHCDGWLRIQECT